MVFSISVSLIKTNKFELIALSGLNKIIGQLQGRKPDLVSIAERPGAPIAILSVFLCDYLI